MASRLRTRRPVEIGVLAVTIGLVVYVLTRLFFGAFAAFLESALTSVPSTTVRTVVVPAVHYAVDVAIVIPTLLGFYLLRSGRWALPAGGPAKLNLATMALLVGGGAVIAHFLLGIAAGLTSAFTAFDLRVAYAALDLVATAALGLFLFWILDAAALLGPQVVGIVAVVVTSVGSAVEGFARFLPRRVGALDLTTAWGFLVFVIGLFLWLAAYVWGYGLLRSQRLGRGAAAPSGQGTDR